MCIFMLREDIIEIIVVISIKFNVSWLFGTKHFPHWKISTIDDKLQNVLQLTDIKSALSHLGFWSAIATNSLCLYYSM